MNRFNAELNIFIHNHGDTQEINDMLTVQWDVMTEDHNYIELLISNKISNCIEAIARR
jgi:hypothetical protein